MDAVRVENIGKTFRVPIREEHVRSTLRSLVRRSYREIEAVAEMSFRIGQGEIVGFIGPNGAGKSTTMKMLSGILTPSTGSLEVLGHNPTRREPAYLRQIAFIRGSRPLSGPGELTVMDHLRFQQLVYSVADADFRRSVDQLIDMLALDDIIHRQARALSLGEKMRAGLAMSLVYRPQILFLDEPTVGLDVSAVQTFHDFIRVYAQETGATILLTSHLMGDVEILCRRLLVIDHGRLQFDGPIDAFRRRVNDTKIIAVSLARPNPDVAWDAYGTPMSTEPATARISVARPDVPATVATLLRDLDVSDLSVEEPPLSHLVQQVYREGIRA